MSENIKINLSVVSAVNYALQQNKTHLIQSFKIENKTNIAYEDVEIKITSSPNIIIPYTKHVDCLPANSTFAVKDAEPILDADYLASLTESVVVSLLFTVTTKNTETNEEVILTTEDTQITAYAFDEWQGSGFYPDIITSL